ncbi:hypothetical protein D6827_00605 [Candidatus Parcubacteria bacterium]|nr:MAG: hypothetical protein D6827_00605 [Candidatus Parcubacteria bacterium]
MAVSRKKYGLAARLRRYFFGGDIMVPCPGSKVESVSGTRNFFPKKKKIPGTFSSRVFLRETEG